MTHDPEDRQLDELLVAWSQARNDDAARLTALHQRILTAVDDEQRQTADAATKALDDCRDTVALPPRTPVIVAKRFAPWTLIAGALALFLFAAALGAIVLNRSSWWGSANSVANRRRTTQNLPPDFAWLQKDQIAGKSRLLRELNDVFDQRVEWIAETSNHLEIDVRSNRGDTFSNSPSPPIAVRLIVQKRQPDSQDWQVVWALDVVTHDERVARLTPVAAAGAEVELWTYRLPDGMIHVESRLALPGAHGIHATSAAILSDGKPTQVEVEHTPGDEYRMFQFATFLPPSV